jgi:hypothetical protein
MEKHISFMPARENGLSIVIFIHDSQVRQAPPPPMSLSQVFLPLHIPRQPLLLLLQL